MRYKKRNFEAIGKIIMPLVKRHGRESIMYYSNLFNIWETLVGENISKKAQPIRMKTLKGGDQNVLYLGNLDAKRDWGHAKDYVKAMWMMLQQDEPDDYVIATGKQYSVRDFVEEAAPYFGFDIEWMGSGTDEIGIDRNTKRTVISVNQRYFRPTEVESLLGDATKAKEVLGWEPEISFKELVEEMCIYGQ